MIQVKDSYILFNNEKTFILPVDTLARFGESKYSKELTFLGERLAGNIKSPEVLIKVLSDRGLGLFKLIEFSKTRVIISGKPAISEEIKNKTLKGQDWIINGVFSQFADNVFGKAVVKETECLLKGNAQCTFVIEHVK